MKRDAPEIQYRWRGKVPRRIYISMLLCVTSIQQTDHRFLKWSQSCSLNANLMFCTANSTKHTYYCFRNRIKKNCCTVLLLRVKWVLLICIIVN
jgi:hypothetical protein